MEVNRSENDIMFGDKLEKGNFAKETYEVFAFEKYGEIWFPKEYNVFSDTNTFGNPRTTERKITITKALFNPDHEALGLFKPDDIPNGTKVDVPGVDGISFTWKDGRIVDSDGNEVDPYNLKPVSLIGQTLPDLSKFLIKIDPKFIENKMLLVCFWDMNNVQSINYIKTLNKRSNALLDKDLYMVFIHANLKPVLDNTLDPWINKNEILPPVGATRLSPSVLGYKLGVKSIPWLILTDKEHIVSDEGFSITELDEKINSSSEK
jgi:hypothetical protein